ncbi:hypothetical protein [Maridesulfovibrio sp.]|uniref:hypothetical protein n=1 Tax=Maridesulfovibrio sp. TaxID=2795000 RepID=UPI0029CAA958|nr:hypothetical protein [Maridesulfovibrio sp.]
MMKLSQAINGNVVALAQSQKTYKQNVVAVNMVISSILQSKLPALNQYPADWKAFTDSYKEACCYALDWTNSVLARLLCIPDETLSYNDIITMLLNDANTQANNLVKNPQDNTALKMLNNDLKGIQAQLKIVTTFISQAVKKVKTFGDNIPQMASKLQTIADKATADEKVDQKKIDDLKKEIDNLNSDIDSLSASIVALGIADAAAITLGTIATIAAFPEGALAWLFCGPAVAAATVYIALDATKIKEDKANIESKGKQMDQVTADVATLHIIAQNFNRLATSTTAIEDNLKAILKEWQQLEDDVTAAVNDISEAVTEVKKVDFGEVQKDINDAIKEWKEACTQAGALRIEVKANDAPLKIGMSQEEVKDALAKGKSIDIIEYFNKVA